MHDAEAEDGGDGEGVTDLTLFYQVVSFFEGHLFDMEDFVFFGVGCALVEACGEVHDGTFVGDGVAEVHLKEASVVGSGEAGLF